MQNILEPWLKMKTTPALAMALTIASMSTAAAIGQTRPVKPLRVSRSVNLERDGAIIEQTLRANDFLDAAVFDHADPKTDRYLASREFIAHAKNGGAKYYVIEDFEGIQPLADKVFENYKSDNPREVDKQKLIDAMRRAMIAGDMCMMPFTDSDKERYSNLADLIINSAKEHVRPILLDDADLIGTARMQEIDDRARQALNEAQKASNTQIDSCKFEEDYWKNLSAKDSDAYWTDTLNSRESRRVNDTLFKRAIVKIHHYEVIDNPDHPADKPKFAMRYGAGHNAGLLKAGPPYGRQGAVIDFYPSEAYRRQAIHDHQQKVKKYPMETDGRGEQSITMDDGLLHRADPRFAEKPKLPVEQKFAPIPPSPPPRF